MSDKTSIYETITAKIIAAIEADPGTFKMPWHRSAGDPLHMPSNVVSKKHYRGVNVVMLWITAEMSAFRQPVWGTFRQWAQRDCQVRKGEKGIAILAPIVGRRATHGTHMMDLATGWPSPLQHLDKLAMPAPAEPHDADIVFVQLPRHAQGRQIGGLLRANVLDAVRYIIDCTPPDRPAAINLSYGANAGPHDGSSLLEQALDWQLQGAAQRRSEPVHLVIAAGNARDRNMHISAEVPSGGNTSFEWNNLPGDPSDSFVEIWFPPEASDFSVRVTPPGSQASDWLALTPK